QEDVVDAVEVAVGEARPVVRQQLHAARRGDDRAESVGGPDRGAQKAREVEEPSVPERRRADRARLDVEGEGVEASARLGTEADRSERAPEVAGRPGERRQVPADDAQAACMRRVDELSEAGGPDEVGAS